MIAVMTEGVVTTGMGRWRVVETPRETVFTLPAWEHGWIYLGVIALLWVGWFVKREGGSQWALDLGLAWGFALLSVLLLSLAWNRIEVRVGAQGVARKVGPLPVMEASARFGRAEIVGVHYWQQAVSGDQPIERRSRPTYKAGVRLKNGKDMELVGGFATEDGAARAAGVVAQRLGMEATRLNRGNEPVGWRGVTFLLAILCSSIIVARVADFVWALMKG